MKIPYELWIFLANSLINETYGYNYRLANKNCRLRSLPAALVLVLPMMTPSGFTIGIIKKLILFLSSFASLQLELRN